MDEASKLLMAFTVGLLGFYKCECMPLRLMNVQAMFQRLMEICLGDLKVNWYLIYLNEVIVFLKMPTAYLIQLRAVFEKLKEAGLILKPIKS